MSINHSSIFRGDGDPAEQLRRLYRAAYGAGVEVAPALQRELREVCVESGCVVVSPCGAYWFDDVAAARVVEFFRRYLVHIKGELAGQPIDPMEWEQDEILRPGFGWRRWDGTRRYRRIWVEVPRKNDKTTLAAGIALFLTFADGEPGAEVYSAAADRDQAGICFDIAKYQVESSPALLNRCDVYRRSIVIEATRSSYKVISADAFTKHGLNAHGVIVDEVHAQPNRDLIDVLHSSTSSRRQPLEVYITTAGYDRHSIGYEMHDHAVKVRDGARVDATLLVVIYAADPTDDWRAEATWFKANPGLGRSKKLDYMRTECEHAIMVPGKENTFKRLDLNIWTEQASRWLPMEKWDKCAGTYARERLALGPLEALDPVRGALALREAMRGLKGCGGLDLANTGDINAFVLAFIPDGRRVVLVPYFWIPEERLLERQKRDSVPWAEWVKAGIVKVMPGRESDYDVIRSDIELFGTQYRIEEIAIDRWNALQIATQLARKRSKLAGKEFTVVGFGQGFASMTGPCKALEAAVLGGRLEHGGHPVLRWMAANTAAERDAADNIKPNKDHSAEKIDGIVASLMALGRAIVDQPKGSIDGWLNNPVIAG